MMSQRRTTSSQRWRNVVYVNVEVYNVQLRLINVVYFNIDFSNVRQRRNNVVIFNIDFHNVGQRQNNVVNMTIWINKLSHESKTKFLSFKENAGLTIFLFFFPILRGICKRIFAKPQKFLKHRIYWITKAIAKPSHFLGQSCDMTIVSFMPRFLPLSWCSINLLICVKKISSSFIIIVSRDL